MRILFHQRQQADVEHFEPTLRLMASRGDQVRLVFDKLNEAPAPESLLGRLLRDCPEIGIVAASEIEAAHGRLGAGRARATASLRAGLNYLFYLQPAFRDAKKARKRMRDRAPDWVGRLAGLPGIRTGPGIRALTWTFRSLERLMPLHPGIDRYLRAERPDLVLVAPRVQTGIADYVRPARRLGIRTGLCVQSWDNLTLKGMLHELPDFVTVWNEGQKREAIELHGVPAERVFVTGSQHFDRWFEWKPSTAREEFCRLAGLSPERPFLLYVGSSPFVTDTREAPFIRRWLTSIRESNPVLEEVQVLVRPHPSNSGGGGWRAGYDELADLPDVSVWPVERAKPLTTELRNDFYDSIHHSAAVVGVNTSALIESAIVGRPVLSVRDGELRDSQEGMLHFRLISEFGGGVLTIADSMDEHASQLAEALSGNGYDSERRRRFLEAFVRPHGLERPAAPLLMQAIDEGYSLPPLGRQGAKHAE
jgi:hypothetical protein